MAIHLSISVWKILWMEEPERLQSKGLPRVRGTEHTHIYKAHSWILYSLLLPVYLITCSWIQFSSCSVYFRRDIKQGLSWQHS